MYVVLLHGMIGGGHYILVGLGLKVSLLEVFCCVGLVSSIERVILKDHTEESLSRKKEREREIEKKGGSRFRYE